MKAIMLAAGVGNRLSGGSDRHLPKSLLRFGGRTLLHRHVNILRSLGIEELVLVTGYRADDIAAEVEAIGAGDFVRPVHNPDYRRGSMVSLWTAREALGSGVAVLTMDADVLYDISLLENLLKAPQETCFPLDREFEAGDEPVKLCVADGVPVEFRKDIGAVGYDLIGEWPGFLRLSPASASALADVVQRFIDGGDTDAPYEEAIRAMVLGTPPDPVGIEDITSIPWIEIDFPEDLKRAEAEILPRIVAGVSTIPERSGPKLR